MFKNVCFVRSIKKRTEGHNGNLFTHKAMSEGMKGWHLRGYHKKFFKDFNEKGLSSFLYWGESYE